MTGASSGIGKAVALGLAEDGADVALNYFSLPEGAEDAAGRIRAMGRKAMLCPVDVSDQAGGGSMIERVAAEMGRLDVLVTLRRLQRPRVLPQGGHGGVPKDHRRDHVGRLHCLRAAVNQMLRQGGGGSIVVVSSGHAQVAIPSCMAYNMAKAALDQMARTAAVELVKHRIRVNILYPGWTDTPGERKYFSEESPRSRQPLVALGPARSGRRRSARRPLPRRSRFGLHHGDHAHHRRRRLAAVVVETRDRGILTALTSPKAQVRDFAERPLLALSGWQIPVVARAGLLL